MSWKILVCTGLLCVIAAPALAQPEVRVIEGPPSGGNQTWMVQVKPWGQHLFENPNRPGPDAFFAGQPSPPRQSMVDLSGYTGVADPNGLFHEGGSLGVEISLTSTNAVVAGVHNSADWSVDPVVGNPSIGNNPFIQDLSAGVSCGVDGCDGGLDNALGDPVAGMTANQVFISLGSDVFDPFPGDTNADSRVDVSDTGIFGGNLGKDWSGNPADPRFDRGRRVADYNGDNKVDVSDTGVFGGGLGKTFWNTVATLTTMGTGGTVTLVNMNVDPVGGSADYTSSRIAQGGANFDGLASGAGSGSGALGAGGVPEPGSLVLVLLGALVGIGRRSRR